MEEITGFSAQITKRVVKNKFLQPITTSTIKSRIKTATMPKALAVMPINVRTNATPKAKAVMPINVRTNATPKAKAVMPINVRTNATPMHKKQVKTLVPQIIPAAAMPLKPATLKASSLAKKIKSITPVSMPIKAENVQTFKSSTPIKSEVIKEQLNEIETAQEIQPKTDKPMNKNLLIGGSIAAVAALYFLTKKRKK